MLLKLSKKNSVVNLVLKYREFKKLKSTYVDALPEIVSNYDNLIHTNYAQTVTATGRLSSNNPNLQNIPIRTPRGQQVRKAFIPRDKEHVLVAADYSQIELRIIAALSKDLGMVDAFQNNEDIRTYY